MCFSATAVESFLIWLVIVCAIVGILKILLPWILELGGIAVSPRIVQIINILVIAVVIIFVIIIVFTLFKCLGGAGLLLPGRP